jgi:hypothetical protein
MIVRTAEREPRIDLRGFPIWPLSGSWIADSNVELEFSFEIEIDCADGAPLGGVVPPLPRAIGGAPAKSVTTGRAALAAPRPAARVTGGIHAASRLTSPSKIVSIDDRPRSPSPSPSLDHAITMSRWPPFRRRRRAASPRRDLRRSGGSQ